MATPRRILVVEDEPALVDLLTLYLERSGYAVTAVSQGAAAFAALAVVGEARPDLVLLDIGLPGEVDGIEVCRRMRAADDWTPVVFVTARDDEVDRVLGLELGADDYVTKPYSPRELVARVRSVLRRHDAPQGAGAADTSATGAGAAGRTAGVGPAYLTVGEVTLDVDARRCTVGGVRVELTATEFDLLAFLMRAPGRVHPRGVLLTQVWGYPTDDGSRTVDVHVAQLRAKLGAASPIRTVRGVGYAAEVPGS